MIHRPFTEQRALDVLLIVQKQMYDTQQLFVYCLKRTERATSG